MEKSYRSVTVYSVLVQSYNKSNDVGMEWRIFEENVCIMTGTELRGRSPQANYTDRATATCRRT
jgi:hypothetical protein